MALFGLGGSLLGRSLLRLGLILGNRFLSHGLVLLGGLLRRRLLGGGFGLAGSSRFLSVGGLLLRSRPLRLGLLAMLMNLVMIEVPTCDMRLQVETLGPSRRLQLLAL